MSYGKLVAIVVICALAATPFLMKHRSAQAESSRLKLYCDTAPVEAARDGVDCVHYKKTRRAP